MAPRMLTVLSLVAVVAILAWAAGCCPLVPSTETAAVPSVVGQPQAQAVALIESSGLVASVTKGPASASAVPEGQVIAQTPGPGSVKPKGSTVAIVISGGKDTVTVPDLIGMTEQQAASALTALGLEMELSEVKSSGPVVKQQPSAGTEIEPGAVVEIALSDVEPEPAPEKPRLSWGVLVPKVTGMGIEAAKQTLKDVGLRPQERWLHGPTEPGAGPMGVVYRQQPAAGTRVLKGTKVVISSWWESG